ncbi:MAG: methyltransferase domain-containing protein [Eubacterium sp.]|nr:methyltransferase domain-containing protein [Eubacterium sp.]
MQTYEQVDNYMEKVGLKYVKDAKSLIAGLVLRVDKHYAEEVGRELNSRAEGLPADNASFYEMKNRYFEGSIFLSAAFDGGVFRHIGNMVIDNADRFKGEVLDLCCDCGIVTCFMAENNPESHFTGIDINESAIENAKQLAEKLGLNNVEFICKDVYELDLGKQFDAVTSFRSLLDAAEKQTKGLNYIGLRDEREETYKTAFTPFAEIVAKHLKPEGFFLSVERYTAEYGWLGWMQALAQQGIYANGESGLMRAQDISSVKEYSVTYAAKGEKTEPIEVFNEALSKQFKSGTGYDGGMAEFALYYDSTGEIEHTLIYKNNRVIHQYSLAYNEKGKLMYYDASNDTRKIKYINSKKEESVRSDIEKNLALYDENIYTVKQIKA